MGSITVFQAIADFLQWTFQFYDNVGDILNWSFIALGFFGFGYWMRWQKKFNDLAAQDPNQIK